MWVRASMSASTYKYFYVYASKYTHRKPRTHMSVSEWVCMCECVLHKTITMPNFQESQSVSAKLSDTDPLPLHWVPPPPPWALPSYRFESHFPQIPVPQLSHGEWERERESSRRSRGKVRQLICFICFLLTITFMRPWFIYTYVYI